MFVVLAVNIDALTCNEDMTTDKENKQMKQDGSKTSEKIRKSNEERGGG